MNGLMEEWMYEQIEDRQITEKGFLTVIDAAIKSTHTSAQSRPITPQYTPQNTNVTPNSNITSGVTGRNKPTPVNTRRRIRYPTTPNT